MLTRWTVCPFVRSFVACFPHVLRTEVGVLMKAKANRRSSSLSVVGVAGPRCCCCRRRRCCPSCEENHNRPSRTGRKKGAGREKKGYEAGRTDCKPASQPAGRQAGPPARLPVCVEQNASNVSAQPPRVQLEICASVFRTGRRLARKRRQRKVGTLLRNQQRHRRSGQIRYCSSWLGGISSFEPSANLCGAFSC